MKNPKLYLIIVVLFQLLKGVCFAQSVDWKTVDVSTVAIEYQKSAQYYNTLKSMTMKIAYISYPNYTSSEESDKSIGFFKRDGLNYHSYIMSNRTIQNSKYKFSIDEVNKTILVWDVDKIVGSVIDFDVNKLSSNLVDSIKIARTDNETRIRIDYKKEFEIQAMEYSISKAGYVAEATLFYCRKYVNELGEEEILNPRVRIIYSDVKTNYSADKNEFDNSTYFTEKDKTLHLSSAYQTYKIRDLRKSK